MKKKKKLLAMVEVKDEKIPCYFCEEDVGDKGIPITQMGYKTWGDWYTPKGWIIPAGRWTVPLGCENCYLRNITKVLSYAKYCAGKYPEIEIAIGQLEVAIERIAWLNMPALKEAKGYAEEAMACLKDKSQRDNALSKIYSAIKTVKQNATK